MIALINFAIGMIKQKIRQAINRVIIVFFIFISFCILSIYTTKKSRDTMEIMNSRIDAVEYQNDSLKNVIKQMKYEN